MTTQTFRTLLVGSIALSVIGLIIDTGGYESMPPLLQLYLEGWTVVANEFGHPSQHASDTLYLQLEYEDTISMAGVASLVGFVILIPIAIVTYIGLFRLQAWGAWLMLGVTALSLLAAPLLGPTVASGWAGMLYTSGEILWGIILAIIFIGPMRPAFFGDGPLLSTQHSSESAPPFAAHNQDTDQRTYQQ